MQTNLPFKLVHELQLTVSPSIDKFFLNDLAVSGW